MSYSVEWIEPIYDRVYADVLNIESNPNSENTKGCFNAKDLNRIENNTRYVMEDMVAREIIKVPPALAIKTNWVESDIPTSDDMSRIISNIKLLMGLSNPVVLEEFHIIYDSTQINYVLANAIEKNLEILKNQPELPVQKWLLKITNGIIVETNTSSEYLEENQIVHIKAIPSGENVEHMIFEHWSGDTNDLQYVGETDLEETTFQMVYHDNEFYEVQLNAIFKTRIPRKLTLHGGVIYDDLGGSTRDFYAGDEILLLADTAADGKRFHSWKGTPAAIENLTGGPEPSTSWLTMPDCDAELTSFYINAGQHSVTVDGNIQGWYDYEDYVYLVPASKGDKYAFSYWSGDTHYLDSVTSSYFKMPDVNVRFTSNWTYIYSYNTVNVINGKINGESKGENLRENSGHQIVADPAPEGYTFNHWTLEGVGSFGNIENSTTTFYVGDGNAIITATYIPTHRVTLENVDNLGGTSTFLVGEGKKYSIQTTEVLAEKMFQKWNRDGQEYNSKPQNTNLTMGTTDITYTAIYRDRNSYALTIVGGSGSGTYKERESVSIQATESSDTNIFEKWEGNYYSIGSRWNQNTSIVMPSQDCTVTAIYTGRIYHNVTVINGSGSGTYYEGQSVKCYGNQAPESYEFSHWTEGDNVISYANPYNFTMGSNDREITAHYKEIPYFTVTVINGSGSGTYIRNSKPVISMNPAPEGMKFFQWEILEGDDNDVYQPLAETTYIRNLTHDVKVQATYYIPDEERLYTLTIVDKEGNSTTENYPMGERITIYADSPDEGYVFYKWDGDTQYLIDKYATPTVVNMPGKDIRLEMLYQREDHVTTYHVILYGGELLLEIDPETQEKKWGIEGEFLERDVVHIRAIDIQPGWKFNGWKNDDDGGKSISTVADLTLPETTLTVEDFNISLTRDVIRKKTYELKVVNGETSGTYYWGEPVSIYFNLKNTEITQYNFIRWSGNDLAYLKLNDGGSFDIFDSGKDPITGEIGLKPQVISMPERNITITANYETRHRLRVEGGKISEIDLNEFFYPEGSKIQIIADEPEEGKRFSKWSGDTSYLSSPFSLSPIVTIPNGAIELKAIFVNKNEPNDVALVENEIYESQTIASSEVVLLSGQLEKGCLVADKKGHLYTVIDIVDTDLTIIRLTQKRGGISNGK